MRSPYTMRFPACPGHVLSALAILWAAGAPCAHGQTFVKDGQQRKVSTWAAKGLMQNPVSICFDHKGNLYVAESDRAGNAVADTRGLGHLNAVEEDLKFKSVEDRREQIHRWIRQGAFPADHFTKTEDRVRLVRDTDGDGVADAASIFAGGFNDELDGIGAGVLWHDGGIYYTCIPNVWKLTPGADPLVAQTREVLSHGYGIRWCFYGHDLHGLVLGPDGRIYFSMGDRGYNVRTKEGVDLVGPDRGGVFRCWPDGTGLELFYQGLRNPQELAFSENGELFTGDNNCDSGDRARAVHIFEGGDSGWRQDVQSLESRGPWNREAIWKTTGDVDGPARPAWTLPPMEYMGAGPSGLLLYPGTGESSAYDGCLFMVDFYGSGSTIHAFRPTPSGAGYVVSDHVEYYKGVTVTDIVWGYDGRLYMSDWGGGWEPNPNGTVLVVENAGARQEQDGVIKEIKGLFDAGFEQVPDPALLGFLGHRDQRVRLAAQYELARRVKVAPSSTLPAELIRIAADPARRPVERYHAIWAIGQCARSSAPLVENLWPLVKDRDAEIRTQAIKTLGDIRPLLESERASQVIDLLGDPSPRVRAYAALALGKSRVIKAIDPLMGLLDSTGQSDRVLRHAASHALALINRPDETLAAARRLGPLARLGAVVALRAMNSPGAAEFITDADPAVQVESARAIYDLRIAGGMEALARTIEKPLAAGAAIEPFLRRAIEANVFLGTEDAVNRLASFAARGEVDANWRLLALQRVAGWNKPLKREGVWGNWADYPARSEEALSAAVRANIDALLASAGSEGPLAKLGQQLQATYALSLGTSEMVKELANPERSDEYRRVLLDRIATDAPDEVVSAATAVLSLDPAPKGALRGRAEELLAKAAPLQAVEYLLRAASTGEVPDRQRAVRILGTIDSPEAREAMADLADRVTTGMLSPALALEIYEASMKLPADSSARIRAEAMGRQGSRPAGFSTALLASGGDVAAGHGIFLHHTVAECLRCHIVEGTGGTAGPELTRVATRLSIDKIVESVVEPTATVAAGYGTVSAMPQMTQILNPRQVRDVVAYLATLKGEGGSAGHGGGVAATTPHDAEGVHGSTAASQVKTTPAAATSPLIRVLAFLLIPITLIMVARSMTARARP